MTQELKLMVILLILGVGLILGFKFLFPIVAPFLLGIIFAVLIEPMVRRLEKRFQLQRSLAVSLVLVSFLIAILGLTGITVLSSFREAARQLPKISVLVNKLSSFSTGSIIHLSRFFNYNFSNFSIDSKPFATILRSFVLWVLGFLQRLPEIIFTIALGGISAYLFSRDKQFISQLFYRCLPDNWQLTTIQIKDEIITKISKFFRAELVLCLITTILTTVFFIILGIPGAFTYGFFTGILDLIPVIGPGMIYVPFIIAQLLMSDYYQGFGLIIGYLLVLLIRQIVEVRLIGSNFDFHPLITLMIIYIGLKVFGFSGIFFGPVLIITLRAIYRVLAVRFVKPRLGKFI